MKSKKGLTRPVPAEAMPIIELLRRDVRRPQHLPVGNPLRFDMALVKRMSISGRGADVDNMGWSCPMGLHPEARGRDEPYGLPFGDAGEALGDWWDEQTDAKAAVDAVWNSP